MTPTSSVHPSVTASVRRRVLVERSDKAWARSGPKTRRPRGPAQVGAIGLTSGVG
jgi:hypothetical protein